MKISIQNSLMSLPLLVSLFLPTLGIAATASQVIEVSDPYARAVPPGQPNSAMFMQLKNNAGQDHAIVNASSDVSKVVELHTHTNEGGMMKMRRIQKIDIAANGNTTLKPGGLHIMLIKLHKDLTIGQNVSVTLEFEDGSKKTVTAPVRKIMMKGMMKGMDYSKHMNH